MAKKLKEWFDRDCAVRLGEAIQPHYRRFDVAGYATQVDAGVSDLELKDRVLLMARGLREQLPDDYMKMAKILSRSLGPPLEGETGMFTEGYWLMPVARLVEEFGHEHFDVSLELCAEITRRHTAEYAVRPYIEMQPARALERLREWTKSPDLHIRRLSSEAARPRLPWSQRLTLFIDNPDPVIELVTPLREDSSRYVQKSVANMLNDISKDHPTRIQKLARDWSRSKHPVTQWIVRHGTRTLRKNAK